MIRHDLARGALAMALLCAIGCGGTSSKSGDPAGAGGTGGSGGVGDGGVGGGSQDTGGHPGVAGSAVGEAGDANAGLGGSTTANGGGGMSTGGGAETSGRAGSDTAGGGIAGTEGSKSGGNAGTSATAGSESQAGSGGMAATTTCEFSVETSLSPKIQTVGIVDWSTSLSGLTSASIEFGLTTSYGMTAPATTRSSGNRTLLLGMKQVQTYHFRLVATSPAGTCSSADFTLETGALSTGLPEVRVTTHDAAALAGGFLVTGQYAPSTNGGAPALIFDADGDIVWAYELADRDVTGARQSYDGASMWINSANVPASQGANVHRVSMDGLEDENLSSLFAGQTHQLTVLPDETVAFYAYSDDDCFDIKQYDPETDEMVTLLRASEANGPTCHVEAIEYSPSDDTLLFSDLFYNSITKLTRTGEIVWVLGGSRSDFAGDSQSWQRQNGLHPLAPDRLLFFNNGELGETASTMIEVALDLDARTAEQVWTYSDPSLSSGIFGDVQRLPNGNTVVGYALEGVVQEVSAEGEVLQQLEWPSGHAFGYIQKRPSLYGPPPR